MTNLLGGLLLGLLYLVTGAGVLGLCVLADRRRWFLPHEIEGRNNGRATRDG